MPSYSVIAADTLRDLVILTFDLLILVSCHIWRVTWSSPPPSLKILRLSVLDGRADGIAIASTALAMLALRCAVKMELSVKTVYGPVLKITQLSVDAQNHASPERCRKSFTMIFLGDHDIPLTGSTFGNLIPLTGEGWSLAGKISG